MMQVGHGKSGTAQERVWHKGPPPHVGWWNASNIRNRGSWRWWDGRRWSLDACAAHEPSYVAVRAGQYQSVYTTVTEWTHYYPEGARVPRVDPSDPKNKPFVHMLNADTPELRAQVWRAIKNREAWPMTHVGSTRTVREMKAKLIPPPFPPVPKGYVAGNTSRLSDSVRIGDADFTGAMKRNTLAPCYCRRGDKDLTGADKRRRSNSQAPAAALTPEARELDPFAGISTMALMKEVFRRLG